LQERILIVDDDPGLRESLELVLAAEGYEVVGAQNADEALGQLTHAPVDVVLCDLRMPGMNGMELLPELVRRLPSATVIMMSAYGSADLAIEAMKRGAYDYLPSRPQRSCSRSARHESVSDCAGRTSSSGARSSAANGPSWLPPRA
jgi:DNA-binding NtrC family response regulator